ncbi:MAG: hypothetical protein ACI32N_03600 [Bulleidia sp.]
MQTDVKKAYAEEVRYQTRMIHNLKRWMAYCFGVSSVALAAVITCTSFPLIHFLGIAVMIISVIICVLIGWSVKQGQDNVNRILDLMEHE